MQIANISGAVVRFTDKSGKVVEIEPGMAEPVDIDRNNPFVLARERANLVRIGGTEAQAKKAARERTPVAPADTLTE